MVKKCTWLKEAHVVHHFTPQCYVSSVTRALVVSFFKHRGAHPSILSISVCMAMRACGCLICANWERKFSFRKKPSKPKGLLIVQLWTWACTSWKLLQEPETHLLKQSVHCAVIMARGKADFSHSLLYFWGHKSLIMDGRGFITSQLLSSAGVPMGRRHIPAAALICKDHWIDF